jgi:hypothetical protein
MAEPFAHAVHFQTLSEAIDFICTQIEAGNPAALSTAMAGLHRDDAYDFTWYFATLVFPALCARHRRGCLRALYAGRVFPDAALSYKLGGHDSELGNVHVDFVRRPEGWVLQRIWVCQ